MDVSNPLESSARQFISLESDIQDCKAKLKPLEKQRAELKTTIMKLFNDMDKNEACLDGAKLLQYKQTAVPRPINQQHLLASIKTFFTKYAITSGLPPSPLTETPDALATALVDHIYDHREMVDRHTLAIKDVN